MSSYSCQKKQSLQEISKPSEIVSRSEYKKQPQRPEYAIKAPDFQLRTTEGKLVKFNIKGSNTKPAAAGDGTPSKKFIFQFSFSSIVVKLNLQV